MYCLKITRKDGSVSKHYYETYEELDYNATFCQFSANIAHAEGLKFSLLGWKEIFNIG